MDTRGRTRGGGGAGAVGAGVGAGADGYAWDQAFPRASFKAPRAEATVFWR